MKEEKKCDTCCRLVPTYSRENNDPHVFLVHTERKVITCRKKDTDLKEQKKLVLHRIEKICSALRNTTGGVLLVHIQGQCNGDENLEYFHEIVGPKLENLIDGGEQYVDTYLCKWLHDISVTYLKEFHDVVYIKVKRTSGISTAQVNTRLRKDHENTFPTTLNIVHILSREKDTKRLPPMIRGTGYLVECRNTEVKSLPSTLTKEASSDPLRLAEIIWSDLKLKDNITSMSKLEYGGSYYVGIYEQRLRKGSYVTKEPQITGFIVPGTEELKNAIEDKINSEICVLSMNGIFGDAPPDLTDIQFHEVKHAGSNNQTASDRYVLEVSIRYFDGIVFYDREGPLAYNIHGRFIRRMDKYEWLRRLQGRMEKWGYIHDIVSNICNSNHILISCMDSEDVEVASDNRRNADEDIVSENMMQDQVLFMSARTENFKAILTKNEDAPCIYPLDVQLNLPAPIQDILLYLTKDNRTFVYVKSPVMTLDRDNAEIAVPSSVICDFFVFPADNPVKILTFVTELTNTDKCYNSVLAQTITKTVLEQRDNFHLEHGVIDRNDWTYITNFETALHIIYQKALDTGLPRSLDMTEDIQKTVVTSVTEAVIEKQHASKDYLGKMSLCVETAAYKRAEENLEHENILMLTGEAGEGKTSIGHRLCYGYHQKGYNIVFYSKLDEINWNVLKTTEPTLVVIDNVDDFDEHCMQLRGKQDNVKLVMIVQMNHSVNVQRHMPTSTMTVDITCIRNENMERTKLEYLKMLHTSQCDNSKFIKELVISKMSLEAGFPKALKLYKKYQHYVDVETYFTYPIQDYSVLYIVARKGDLNKTEFTKLDFTQEDLDRAFTNCMWENDVNAFLYLRDMIATLQRHDIHYNPDCRDSNGNTLLMLAVKSNNKVLVRTLMKEANLLIRDKRKNTALHTACIRGFVEIVKLLCERKSLKNLPGQGSRTPTMMAALLGNKDLYDYLADEELSELRGLDDNGDTILHLACIGGNIDIVKNLLSREGLIMYHNQRVQCSRTPLMVALHWNHRELFEWLLKQDCDIQTQNLAMEANISYGQIEQCEIADDELIVRENSTGRISPVANATQKPNHLLQNKLTHDSNKGKPALDKAIVDRIENVVLAKDASGMMRATEKGHDYYYTSSDGNDNGRTILRNACIGNSVNIVQDILSKNIVDINSRDKHKRTAVMEAAEKGRSDAFKLLVNWECDLSPLDFMHRTILHAACIGGNENIVKKILSWNKNIINNKDVLNRTAVMEAAENGHRGVFDMLVIAGCYLLGSDDREYNILHFASRGGNKDIVKYVLSHSLVPIDSRDCKERTPVMWAVERGHKGVFDLLVEKGCDLSVVDNQRWNILHCACYGGNTDIVQYIISNNIVDINIKDNNRRTPLKILQYRQHTDMEGLFLQRGC